MVVVVTYQGGLIMVKTYGIEKSFRSRRGGKDAISLIMLVLLLDTWRQLQGVVVLWFFTYWRILSSMKFYRPLKTFYAADGFRLDITKGMI